MAKWERDFARLQELAGEAFENLYERVCLVVSLSDSEGFRTAQRAADKDPDKELEKLMRDTQMSIERCRSYLSVFSTRKEWLAAGSMVAIEEAYKQHLLAEDRKTPSPNPRSGSKRYSQSVVDALNAEIRTKDAQIEQLQAQVADLIEDKRALRSELDRLRSVSPKARKKDLATASP